MFVFVGGNVLCLEIWKGYKNGDPYLHSIHFAFALGAFISPIIAEPFLCNKEELEIKLKDQHDFDGLNQTIESNNINSTILNEECFEDTYSIPGMFILYPTIGFLTTLSSIGYLIYAIKDRNKKARSDLISEKRNGHDISHGNIEDEGKHKLQKEKVYRTLLIITLLAFLFVYVGMEVMFGTYISTFAVESNLHLSRQEAARVNAAFWGSFAAMRFASVFIAFRISSLYQLMFSFSLCGIGIIVLSSAAEVSVKVLFVCCAVMGTGMASIWACGILWLKQHINVTNRIGSFMIVAGSLGGNSFLIMMGQFISGFPMLLMYLEVILVFLCVVIFTFGFFVAKRLEINNR